MRFRRHRGGYRARRRFGGRRHMGMHRRRRSHRAGVRRLRVGYRF